MVDATDIRRFQEARNELSKLLTSEPLQKIPFLILGNKIDAREAVSEMQIKEALGIDQTTGKKPSRLPPGTQPIEVFMCSVVKRAGYAEGFRWFSEYLP